PVYGANPADAWCLRASASVARGMHTCRTTLSCSVQSQFTEEEPMKSKVFLMAIALLLASVGCSRAESPTETRHDTTQAQQQAQKKVADAQKDAAETKAKAQEKMSEDAQDATNEQQKSQYDVAMAKAEGDAKVALEACESESGAAQKACKDRANANLEI